MSFRRDDDKVIEKYKSIWNEIKDLRNIELNALSTYDGRYIKAKIRTYGNMVYDNFWGLNVPEDGVDYKSLSVISTDFVRVYVNIYYLQVYLDNCAHEILNKRMIDYLDDNLFKTDEK